MNDNLVKQKDKKEPHKCKDCGKEITSKWDKCCSCDGLENM